jgi:hypothetical protein
MHNSTGVRLHQQHSKGLCLAGIAAEDWFISTKLIDTDVPNKGHHGRYQNM